MRLRDHPAMVRKSGYCSWPPVWTTSHPERDESPKGEVGVLEDVVMSHLIDNKVFLFMRLRDWRYMGVLVFDDDTWCRVFYEILKENIDLSIEQIGDLDSSHLL